MVPAIMIPRSCARLCLLVALPVCTRADHRLSPALSELQMLPRNANIRHKMLSGVSHPPLAGYLVFIKLCLTRIVIMLCESAQVLATPPIHASSLGSLLPTTGA
ncbi:hypothetical protein GQ53DRAFT_369722 [Thozetella sp. PMI_491]|nr:hypothetical protein GQ53DRAFT_369722 [Thozetella sp. PMI_491]